MKEIIYDVHDDIEETIRVMKKIMYDVHDDIEETMSRKRSYMMSTMISRRL